MHARIALYSAKTILLNKGMRTLDPNVKHCNSFSYHNWSIKQDMQYCGSYNNSDDSFDRIKAKGFNYHNVSSTIV